MVRSLHTKKEGLDTLCAVHVVVSWHDKLASHLVKLMPAHVGGAVRGVRVGADPNAELVITLECEVSPTVNEKIRRHE